MQTLSLPRGLGLRIAGPADTAFLQDLFHSTRQQFYLAEQENEYVRLVIDSQLDIQQQGYAEQFPNAIHFIIDKLGTKIGKLTLDFGHNLVHIIDIAFIPDARMQGYGKALIQAVQHIAQKQHLPVGLSVEKQNTQARQLYTIMGFVTEDVSLTHEFMLWYPNGR